MKKVILPVIGLILVIAGLSTSIQAFMGDPCDVEVGENLRTKNTESYREKCIKQEEDKKADNDIVHQQYLANQAAADLARKNIAKTCEVDKIATGTYPESCSGYVNQDLAYQAPEPEADTELVPQQAPDQVQPKLDQASPLSNLIGNEVDGIDL